MNYKLKFKIFNSKSKIRNLKSRGFSLIEAMAAVLIIVIGLIGVLSLVEQNIKAQNVNKNGLIASQLAQEGLEAVRYRRDKSLVFSSWQDFKSNLIGDPGSEDLTLTIDYNNTMNSSADNIDDADAKLYINNGFYDHTNTGTPTIFSRLIDVVDNGDYLDVKCTVQWQEKGNTKQYAASTLLYDWR